MTDGVIEAVHCSFYSNHRLVEHLAQRVSFSLTSDTSDTSANCDMFAAFVILLLWILVTVEYLLAGCASILFEHLHLHLVTRLTVRYATFFRSLVIVDTVSFWATQTTLLFAHLVNNLMRSFTR